MQLFAMHRATIITIAFLSISEHKQWILSCRQKKYRYGSEYNVHFVLNLFHLENVCYFQYTKPVLLIYWICIKRDVFMHSTAHLNACSIYHLDKKIIQPYTYNGKISVKFYNVTTEPKHTNSNENIQINIRKGENTKITI